MDKRKERKTTYLRVRLTPEHRGKIDEAARRKGISVSAWVTERMLDCARRELVLVEGHNGSSLP